MIGYAESQDALRNRWEDLTAQGVYVHAMHIGNEPYAERLASKRADQLSANKAV